MSSSPFSARTDEGDWVSYWQISHDPLVAVTSSEKRIFRAILHASAAAAGRPAYLFVRVSAEIDWQVAHLGDVKAFIAGRAPNVTLKFLATNGKAMSVLASLGLDSVLCSPNAFVDEFEMTPCVPQAKTWDAIYNARFIPLKRHWLAARISSLALIGAPWGTRSDEVSTVRDDLPKAEYLNFSENGEYKNLDRKDVCQLLNRARVGLILSETEGANLATMEYLLCGIPVVSTWPAGGRELFLPPSVCEIADANPVEVARAVGRLIARNLDPAEVRNVALNLMLPHRRVFLRELEAILGAGLEKTAGERAMLPGTPYALLHYLKIPDYA